MKIETKGNPLSFPPKLKNPYPNFPKNMKRESTKESGKLRLNYRREGVAGVRDQETSFTNSSISYCHTLYKP
jgi:hypothetical protein